MLEGPNAYVSVSYLGDVIYLYDESRVNILSLTSHLSSRVTGPPASDMTQPSDMPQTELLISHLNS